LSRKLRVSFQPPEGGAVNRVSEILGDKGQDVLEIDADAPVLEAVKRMVDANVGSLLVKHDGEVAGIVSERDYLRRADRRRGDGR
jgi:CBS domain-containing protein